ncbi:sugar nucleotide-binding protein [Umboniibacter marinipuniceus]|uniref:RmlD substrate binding domain-containing protein n=1 Tax=Umboniibacter marinipuniceus TaxID=569599 RepID=A0A3M0ABR5_9GAMM|nr:sugar nucleotide-binding protein [Umboniibacter marinipuniceus]RMA82066.1 RmlD substrate binding domain-containing protein [Umboniibacter marinipuniceus]
MLSGKNLYLLGYGDILRRVYHLQKPIANRIITFSRNIDQHPEPENAIAAELGTGRDWQLPHQDEQSVVIYTPTPSERSIAGYQQGYIKSCEELLGRLKPTTWLILVSSTRVYRGQQLSIVDDTTQPLAADEFGQVLIDMEALVTANHANTIIVRPSGIYGRSTARWERLMEHPELTGNRLGNRIHADDLARFLSFLIDKIPACKTNQFIVTDGEPASESQVVDYLLGLTRDLPSEGIALQATALTKSGFELHYPSYRKGLLALKR